MYIKARLSWAFYFYDFRNVILVNWKTKNKKCSDRVHFVEATSGRNYAIIPTRGNKPQSKMTPFVFMPIDHAKL